jgi:mono/diheme cytochrome c family protein
MRIHLFFLTGILMLLLYGCSENQVDYRSAEKLFEVNCGSCHGPDGKGKFYRGIPAAILTDKSVDDIVMQIREGSEEHKKIKMRPMENISAENARLIAEFLLMKKDIFERAGNNSELLLKPGDTPE